MSGCEVVLSVSVEWCACTIVRNMGYHNSLLLTPFHINPPSLHVTFVTIKFHVHYYFNNLNISVHDR